MIWYLRGQDILDPVLELGIMETKDHVRSLSGPSRRYMYRQLGFIESSVPGTNHQPLSGSDQRSKQSFVIFASK